MINVFVDPVVVTTPEDGAAREEIERYLYVLTVWLTEALTSPYSWLHTVQVIDLLQSCGRFPDFEVLRSWQKRYGLNINIVQLGRMINQFYRNPELDLEASLENAGYLIDPVPASITILPDQFPARWLDLIRENMHLLLAMTCACKYMGGSVVAKLHIATLALESMKREIEIAALISASEPDFAWSAEQTVSQVLPLLFTPDDLPPPLEVIPFWDKGEDGIRYAINRWYKEDWRHLMTEPFAYTFGQRFIESVNEAGLDTNENVLLRIIRIAASVIADQAKNIEAYKLHPLRESETADSPQRTRTSDHASAWRLMIEKHGAGWRLHYWRIPAPAGIIIEFSNVQKESGSKIY